MAAAVAAACTAWVYLMLPASPAATAALSAEAGDSYVRGAIHVHTRRSDGTGTIDEIAAAAARAGLQFVIATDHGDGTRGSDTPVYRQGVLCIDAVEISTDGGHLVALGLPQAPYPIGGDAGDALEDVRRLGGFSIAAHGDSSRSNLTWADWEAPFDGLEWLNVDSQWRDEDWRSLGRSLLTYPFRRAATLTGLLDRPAELLDRWDAALKRRPVVAVAAADAHARIGPESDPYRRSLSLHLPSYEQIFRTLSISLPGVRLSGDAREDARLVIEAIRNGRTYSTVDGLATPALVAFTASSGAHRAVPGGRLPIGGPVSFRVDTNAPAGAIVRLIKDGRSIASSAPPSLEYAAPPEPGVYRVEIDVPRAPGDPPVPWVVTNPIYAGVQPSSNVSSRAAFLPAGSIYGDGPATGWRIEKNDRSEGAVSVVRSVEGTQLLLRYGLGGTRSESPFVAGVVPAEPELANSRGVIFRAWAMRPMRVSVQVRAADGGDRRWAKSVYVDDTPRTLTIAFDEMLPRGTATGRPALDDVRDLLFVVDTVHTKPGSSGQVWLDDIKYVR